jgi:hypothetical protein
MVCGKFLLEIRERPVKVVGGVENVELRVF